MKKKMSNFYIRIISANNHINSNLFSISYKNTGALRSKITKSYHNVW